MSVRGVCASRRTVAATAARELAVPWRTGWRAVQLNPAAPNAARPSATLGRAARSAGAPGQDPLTARTPQRPANAQRPAARVLQDRAICCRGQAREMEG